MIVDLRSSQGGLTVYSEDEQLTETVKYKLTGLDNWYSSPPIRITIDEIPDHDGAFNPVRSYRGSKPMALNGFVYAPTAQQAIADGWKMVAAVAPFGEPLTLTVTDDDGVLTQRVWLSGAPAVVPFARSKARFQIPITAMDPRKYGLQQTISTGPVGSSGDGMIWPLFAAGYLDFGTFSPSGLFYLTNTGTAESWPVFTALGTLTDGFRVTSEGDTLTYAATVPLGTLLTLSPYAGGRATVGSSDLTVNLSQTAWPSVKPGQTRAFSFAGLGLSDANALITAFMSPASW